MESAENIVGLDEEKPNKEISEETCQFMEKIRKIKCNKNIIIAKVEFSELYKTLLKNIIEDTRRFNCNIIQKDIEENKSLKTTKEI